MCGCYRRYPPLCLRGHPDSVPCTSSCGSCSHLCHQTDRHGHPQPGSDGLRPWPRCSTSSTKTVRHRLPRSLRTPWQRGGLCPRPTNRSKKHRGIPASRRHGPRPRPAPSTCGRAGCRRAHKAGTRAPMRPRTNDEHGPARRVVSPVMDDQGSCGPGLGMERADRDHVERTIRGRSEGCRRPLRPR
jgi:hypothetical protein